MAKRKSFPRLEGKEEEEKKVGGKEFRTDGKIGRQKQQEGWARIAWSSSCPHLRLASVQDNLFQHGHSCPVNAERPVFNSVSTG